MGKKLKVNEEVFEENKNIKLKTKKIKNALPFIPEAGTTRLVLNPDFKKCNPIKLKDSLPFIPEPKVLYSFILGLDDGEEKEEKAKTK